MDELNEKLSKCGHQITKNNKKYCLNPYTGSVSECDHIRKEEICGWRW